MTVPRIVSACTVLTAAVLSGFLCAVPASARAPRPKADHGHQFTFADLSIGTQTLTGITPSLDLYVPRPPGSADIGATLVLRYFASPLLDDRESSLTVSVGGVAVSSAPLTSGQAVARFHLPASTLTGAFNHVHIQFMLEASASGPCRPYVPGRYVTVDGESTVQYDRSGRSAPFHPNLADLPAPFAGTPVPVRSIVVSLPTSPSAAELTAAARILARLGEDQRNAPPDAIIMLGRPPRAARVSPLIIVGTPSNASLLRAGASLGPFRIANKRWWNAAHPLPPHAGVIGEMPSPYNRQLPALIVSGDRDVGIVRAANAVADGELRGFLRGTAVAVLTDPRDSDQTVSLPGTAALSQLTSLPITLSPAASSTSFRVDLPGVPTTGGTLHLTVGGAAAAAATVTVNGAETGEVTGRREKWNVLLPAAALRAGPNTIGLQLSATLPQCGAPPNDDLTVLGGSLTIPPGGEAPPDLGALPYPLVQNGSLASTLVVAPRHPGRRALWFAPLLGSLASQSLPRLTVVVEGQERPAHLSAPAVLLDGVSWNDSRLAPVRRRLPLRDASRISLGQDDALGEVVKATDPVGSVQEVASPWRRGGLVVVVLGPDERLRALANRALFSGRLAGQVATIDRRDHIHTFAAPTPVVTVSGQSTTRPVGVFTVAGALVLAALATIWALKRDTSGGAT